jgi:hypothetical protein
MTHGDPNRVTHTSELLHIEIGDELVEALVRAVRARAPNGMVLASGEIEDAEILALHRDAQGKATRVHRVLRGPCDLLSLTGFVDADKPELRAVVAREGDAGNVVLGGLLVRANTVVVRATVTLPSGQPRAPLPEPSAPKLAPPPTPAPPPVAAPPTAPPTPAPPPVAAPPTALSAPAARPAAPSLPATAAIREEPTPPPRPAQTSSPDLSAVLPPKIHRRNAQPDQFPEENDVVTHFTFGRCVVLSSDGERLRLQQEKDSRVREVSLNMLRIEEPTTLADGRRHWDLARKN